MIHVSNLNTPLGDLLAYTHKSRLVALEFEDLRERAERWLKRRFGSTPIQKTDPMPELKRTLERYFAGDTAALDALQVDAGGTEFQNQVWQRLRQIPAGAPTSYSELAAAIDRPSAVRAVASANANNPIALVIPCHRVIGRNGQLRGYAGGLHRKRWLIEHEARG